MSALGGGDRTGKGEPGARVAQPRAHPSPEDVLAAVIVYVPHLHGYFTNRLAVVRLSLESLIRHKPRETRLLVFDNGSCAEAQSLVADLVDGGHVDLLLRSRSNIGTPAALRTILALGLRPFIAYGDDDVFYYPGWLEAQLAVLSTFPAAGIVSGVPTLDGADHAIDATLRAARADRSIHIDPLARIPEGWEEDWAQSTGREVAVRTTLARETPVVRLEREGLQAFVGAAHFQYVGRADELSACLPAAWPDSLMGDMRDLDEAIDDRGRMRLSTVGRFVRHMGNAVAEGLRREAAELGFEVAAALQPPRVTRLESRLERSRWVHGKIWVTYRRVGRLLDGEAIVPDSVAEASRLKVGEP